MSRRKRNPIPAEWIPVYPTPEAIYAERSTITRTLTQCGVAARDLPDATQEATIAAWKMIQAGRYTPDPATVPALAMRRFLFGLAWRTANHFTDRACNRREIPVPEPRRFAREASFDIEEQLVARAVLRAFRRLPERHRAIIIAATDPESLADYARANGVKLNTARSRLRIAREALANQIRRRLW